MHNKHTPSPWEIGDEHPDTGMLRVLSKKDYICVVMPNPDDEASPEENYGQAKANAALIASAPDLLKALENALNVMAGIVTGELKTLDKNSPAITKARAAIKKAKGEE